MSCFLWFSVVVVVVDNWMKKSEGLANPGSPGLEIWLLQWRWRWWWYYLLMSVTDRQAPV